MNNRFVSGLLAIASILPAIATGLPAKDAPAPAAPELRRDSSPVNDGKSGPVASYADVVEPVQKVVVTISTSRTVRIPVNPLLRQLFGNRIQIPDQQRKEEGLGSGVIVSPDGYILTNYHVVEGADELKVALSDDRKFPAKLVGSDDKTDIAVIKIEAAGLPSVTLADSDKLRVGDVVFAVGNPLGVGETVTMGIVSAKGRNQLGLLDEVGGFEDYIQTDAAINMGNSGGALVDAKGRLVGINSAILSPSRGNVGIGFAIPVNLAASVMQSLIRTGTVSRGYLGAEGQDLTSEVAEQIGLPKDTKGLIVSEIDSDSPADKAGLKASDVILALNDKPVASKEELRLAVAEQPPGATVSLSIMRDGKPVTLSAVLGSLPGNENELLTGVNAVALNDEARRRLGIDPRVTGLIVTEIDPKSPYADVLAPDMIVMEINRAAVPTLAAARALLQKGRNLFYVYHNGSAGFLVVIVK
ncbi:MAG: Do family serine endopeptidase [Opitutaceae bacterium]